MLRTGAMTMRFVLSAALAAVAGMGAYSSTASAQAQPDSPFVVNMGIWTVGADERERLVFRAKDLATSRQRAMIDGGFTTLSRLHLYLTDPETGQRKGDPIYAVRCSIKYDAWMETYDVARLDEKPRTARHDNIDAVAEMCLTANLVRRDILSAVAPRGGVFELELITRQTSYDEAEKIRDWLVQQQSGVMQSLFSHMLGEFTLHQSLALQGSVPARPKPEEPAATNPEPPAKEDKG